MPLSYRIILTILVTGAMASDLSGGRIFNIWLLPAAATGTIAGLYTASAHTGAGIRSIGGSVLTAFIITFIVFLLKGLGAGDVKLAAVSALFMTPAQALLHLGAAFLLAGILAVLMLADDALSAIFAGGRKHRSAPASSWQSTAFPGARRSIPFAVPYGIAVFLLTGGVLEKFWQMI